MTGNTLRCPVCTSQLFKAGSHIICIPCSIILTINSRPFKALTIDQYTDKELEAMVEESREQRKKAEIENNKKIREEKMRLLKEEEVREKNADVQSKV